MSVVNHPDHYNACGPRDEDGSAKYEAIKVIEDWGLGFCLGNAVKYLLRAGHKGKEREDLEKCLWYLNRARGHNSRVAVLSQRTITAWDVAQAWELPAELCGVLRCIYAGYISDAFYDLEALLGQTDD